MNFETSFRISTFCLWLTRSHPALPRNLFWKLQISSAIVVLLFCFCWLSNSVLSYDIPAGNYAEACRVTIMVIICVVVYFKLFILMYYKDGILELISIVDKNYELAQRFTTEEREIVQSYSRRGRKVCQYWLLSNSIICTIFPGKALILMAIKYWQGEPEFFPVFDFTYPAFIEQYRNIPAVFWCQFLFCLFFDCYCNCFYVGFDPLVPILLLHSCGQIDLVSRRIMALFSDTPNSEQLHDKLSKIIVHLQSIYRFVDNVKIYFIVFYEFIMKSLTFLMPLTAFQIVQSLRDKELNVEFMAFFVGTFLSFFMPCYYSDLLMETSERLRTAIYMSGWEKHHDLRIRKHLLFMITRSSEPLVIRTVFYPICLDTFAEACRTSYAIFNLMNTAFT